MKFKIRFADQIVGTLTLIAIIALVLIIFLLGSKQRWFSKDYQFYTSFDSASGISVGMPLQYKGFTIGKIKTIELEENDLVKATFTIYDTYYDRIKEGSLIELFVNPIGLGNQFLFYKGKGNELIADGSFIPRLDSEEGKYYIAQELVEIHKKDDTISVLISQINPLLTNLNNTIAQVSEAFDGTGKGPLARTLLRVQDTANSVSSITKKTDLALDPLFSNIQEVSFSVKEITSNLEQLSISLQDPTGLVPTLIDPSGVIFEQIEASFTSIAGTLNNIEDSSTVLKSQMPQFARLIEDLRDTLVKGRDVLEAVKNNPLLKQGVPDRLKTDASGSNSRNIDF